MAEPNLHRCLRTGRVSAETARKLSWALGTDLSRFATSGRRSSMMSPEDLVRAREAAGLSQRELGARLGHSTGAVVAQIEQGRRAVTPAMRARLCEALERA